MIARFSVVRNYSTNAFLRVKPWLSSTEEPDLTNARQIFGVTMTDSTIGQPVQVMRKGYMRTIPFRSGETWNFNDTLWAFGDGTVTNVRPSGPTPQIYVGTVIQVSGTDADVAVDVQIIPSLGELSGVSQETPVDLDVFIFNAATSVWEPRQAEVKDIRDGRRLHYTLRY